MIVVQRLVTEWTKASRGAPGAVKRNATPAALPLPPGLLERREPYREHEVTFGERQAFEASGERVVGEARLPVDVWSRDRSPARLELLADGSLGVSFRPGNHIGAAAGRPPNGDCFVLPVGTSGRVVWNGRFADYDTGTWWYYRKTVVNVANLADDLPLPADLFLRRSPTHVCSHMGRLR